MLNGFKNITYFMSFEKGKKIAESIGLAY